MGQRQNIHVVQVSGSEFAEAKHKNRNTFTFFPKAACGFVEIRNESFNLCGRRTNCDHNYYVERSLKRVLNFHVIDEFIGLSFFDNRLVQTSLFSVEYGVQVLVEDLEHCMKELVNGTVVSVLK